jgi:hypothetical protein
MKTIIALIALTFLNCTFAQFKVEITPSDSKYAKMQIKCVDQTDCDAKLLSWIEKQKFFKGEWKETQEGSIVSKTYTEYESQDTGETQVVTDIDTGEETTVPVYEQVEVQVTKYFHPSNFSIEQKDISAELAEQALEQAIAKKIACGEATIKFIAKNNVKKQLTVEQRRTMVQTYSSILDLLKSGSVDIAKADIQAVNADGTIVTEQDKTDIVEFITACE